MGLPCLKVRLVSSKSLRPADVFPSLILWIGCLLLGTKLWYTERRCDDLAMATVERGQWKTWRVTAKVRVINRTEKLSAGSQVDVKIVQSKHWCSNCQCTCTAILLGASKKKSKRKRSIFHKKRWRIIPAVKDIARTADPTFFVALSP